MEYRTIDATVISAEDLKKVTLFGKMQSFAVVWVDYHQRRSTRVDKDGSTNPSWNERISLTVPEHLFHQPGSFLHVEIYSKGTLIGNRIVGMAAIPLSELLQHSDGKEVLMYQLRRRSGKVKGAVRLSVRVSEKMGMPANAGYPGVGAAASSEPVTAYPYSDQKPYPAQGYGGYPPQQPYQQYPPQGYYPPQQGYYQQPQYMQPPPRRPGMMGGMGGMGTGLLAGALGGLLVGEMVGDGFGGGYDGGGFDGGGFDGGGFDGGF